MSQATDPAAASLLRGLAAQLESRGVAAPDDPAEAARCLRRAADLLAPPDNQPSLAEPPPADRQTKAPGGRAVLYSDGGSRGNPGPAGAGAVLLDAEGAELAALYRYLGRTTNNVAEYQGLIMGLEEAARRGVRELEVRLDSELIVKQLGGQYRVKSPQLAPLYQKARALLAGFASYRVSHVPRAQNARADALANQAMDQGPR